MAAVAPPRPVAAPVTTPKPTAQAQSAIASVGDQIDASPSKNLKHLEFVSSTACAATTTADSLYKQVRPYTPAFAEPYVAKVEDTVVAYTAPVVATAQDVGEKLLAKADEQVHFVVTTASSVVAKGKENVDAVIGKGRSSINTSTDTIKDLRVNGVQQFSAATQKYFDFLHELSAWVADKISPSKNVARAREQLSAALEAAKYAADPDVAVAKVTEAWNRLASIPAVNTVLTKAEPVTKLGTQTFTKAHDTVVGSPYYKQAYKLSGSTLSWATGTYPYKLSSTYLYPWVAPIADPALDKIQKSKSINGAIDYWKPAATA